MNITIFENAYATESGKVWKTTIKEFCDQPCQIIKEKKNAKLMFHGKLKDNSRTKPMIVEERDGIVLDFDHVYVDIVDRIKSALEVYTYILSNTHSHDPDNGNHCYRVWVATAEPIKNNYKFAYWNFILDNPKLKAMHDEGMLDVRSEDEKRCFFAQSIPPKRQDKAFKYYHQGVSLKANTRIRKPVTNTNSDLTNNTELAEVKIYKGTGQRNNFEGREIGKLIQAHKNKEIVLREALIINETRIVPPESPQEIIRQVNNLWDKHIKDNPNDETQEVIFGRRSYKIKDLKNLPKVNWLVDGVLVNKGIASIYGASGYSKSFLAIDLAMNLALGNSWFAIPVTNTVPVIYVALEGFSGVAKRLQGWDKYNRGCTPDNLEVTKDELLLAENKSVDEFINFYKDRDFINGMIVIDTLNNACPNIDENHAGAMSGVIYNLKRIQQELDSTVLIIHHSGKNIENGMRGSSSLKASMDSVIHVTQSNNGLCSWVLEKSKDSESGIGYSYRLEEIQMEDDETTCVIKIIGSHKACEKKVSLGSNQERIFVLLKNEILSKFSKDGDMETTIKNIATQWTEQPTDKRTNLIRAIIGKLVVKGLVDTGIKEGIRDRIWITESGMKQ